MMAARQTPPAHSLINLCIKFLDEELAGGLAVARQAARLQQML
jgi:hypothetical protein